MMLACIWLCLLNFKWNFTTMCCAHCVHIAKTRIRRKNLVNNTSRITLIQIGYIIPQTHTQRETSPTFCTRFFFLVVLSKCNQCIQSFCLLVLKSKLYEMLQQMRYDTLECSLLSVACVCVCCNSTLNGIK